MQHIDEHILELYVLNAEEIAARRAEIEAHLGECNGCRALVDEITRFYEDLGDELREIPETEVSADKALARRNLHLNRLFDRDTPAYRYRPSSPLAKIFYFVRRHPVPVTLGSFALFAALGWFLKDATDSMSSLWKDKAPDHLIYDTMGNSINVLNKEDEELWKYSAENIQHIKNLEDKHNNKYAVLEDINGDGLKELITTVRKPGDKSLQAKFRIMDADQKYFVDKYLHEPFEIEGSPHYTFDFDAGPILVYKPPANGKKEIFLGAHNVGHSPHFIGRYDNNGAEIGKYWHYGALNGLWSLDLNGDGTEEIITFGQNDQEDKSFGNLAYAILTVLDASKIVGNRKSMLAGGYKFPYSDAEIDYIRFPLTDINLKSRSTSSVVRVDTVGFGNIRVSYEIIVEEGNTLLELYFTLTKDFKMIDVKSSTYFDKYRSRLVSDKLLKARKPDEYFSDLKNRVEYWDGKKWGRKPTGIIHCNSE